MTRVVAGLAIATAAVGCMRYTIPYQSQMPRLQAAGGGHSIALAVQDGRRDVAFGVKAPQFCGFQRNGYGIPHPIYTESGHPLATELAQAVAHGLHTRGFRVVIVPAVPGPPDPAIMQALASARTDRSLFIHFTEWYSDTLNNTGLKYQALADVRDGEGRPLAASQVAGNDNLGGNFFDPGGHMADAVPAAAQTILERLLNDPAITRALEVGATGPSPKASVPGASTNAAIQLREEHHPDQSSAAWKPSGVHSRWRRTSHSPRPSRSGAWVSSGR